MTGPSSNITVSLFLMQFGRLICGLSNGDIIVLSATQAATKLLLAKRKLSRGTAHVHVHVHCRILIEYLFCRNNNTMFMFIIHVPVVYTCACTNTCTYHAFTTTCISYITSLFLLCASVFVFLFPPSLSFLSPSSLSLYFSLLFCHLLSLSLILFSLSIASALFLKRSQEESYLIAVSL